MSQTILYLLIEATWQTFYMVAIASLVGALFGVPLGILLYITRNDSILPIKSFYQIANIIVNITRSIPFVILMIAIIPFTRLIVGSSIGTNAAIVPLAITAIPFLARIIENALLEVKKGLIESAEAMGATPWQIIKKILVPEALPGIINGIILTIVSLVSYSAMAGAVGGGGLGDVAIRYGYQRFDLKIMFITIIIMVAMVQLIQLIGDFIVKTIIRSRN